MISAIRWTLAGLAFFFGSMGVLIVALVKPGDPRIALLWARIVPPMGLWLLGIRLEIRGQHHLREQHPCVVIANHQHAFDMFTCASVLCTPIVAVGKREVVNVPIFGSVFRLTGQILINRGDHESAMESMAEAARAMMDRQLSVWMFPEGTRSKGKPLGPFKKGAFHLAIQAGRPIVPIAVSTYHKTLKLNSWRPGKVILEVMPPVFTDNLGPDNVESLRDDCRTLVQQKIESLDQELMARSARPS